MTTPCRLAAVALLAAPLAAPAAQPAARHALSAAPRVLHAAFDSVKADGGGYTRVETTVTYDPTAGTYAHVVRDAEGRVLSESVQTTTVAGPTEEEAAAARALIAAHPDVARAAARARRPLVVGGGFPLVREEGHACGPGSRCLTYDVLEPAQAGEAPRRVRYVVVDLRHGRVLPADPVAEGNLAHPAARRQSRSW